MTVRNMVTGSSRGLPAGQDVDYPRVGGSLLVYNPGIERGVLGLYAPARRRLVILNKPKQITVRGYQLNQPAISPGIMAQVGVNAYRRHGQWVTTGFTLVTIRFHTKNPLHDVLTCE
ncbi:MAG TPA: hypothetical protein VFB34_10220 [Chloroflexota bacterium]|nr:hypothetical protein [Chloroflexota bacterium]